MSRILYSASMENLEASSGLVGRTCDAAILNYSGFPDNIKEWVKRISSSNISIFLPNELIEFSRRINTSSKTADANKISSIEIASSNKSWKETPHVDKESFEAGMDPLSLWVLIGGAVAFHAKTMPYFGDDTFIPETDRLLEYDRGIDVIRPDVLSEFSVETLTEPTMVVFATGEDKSKGIHPALHYIQTLGATTRSAVNVTYCDFFAQK